MVSESYGCERERAGPLPPPIEALRLQDAWPTAWLLLQKSAPCVPHRRPIGLCKRPLNTVAPSSSRREVRRGSAPPPARKTGGSGAGPASVLASVSPHPFALHAVPVASPWRALAPQVQERQRRGHRSLSSIIKRAALSALRLNIACLAADMRICLVPRAPCRRIES